jgi:hypothetical protein
MFSITGIYAQSAGDEQNGSDTYTSIGLNYHAGKVLPTNDFLKGENSAGKPIDYFQALRIEFSWQTTGRKDWERVYNYPSYGIGFYGADFFNEEELGQPSALYGFFNGAFKRWGNWVFGYNIGFGLTWNWNPFDPDANVYNIAIGSYKTVYIDLGLSLQYRLSRRFDVDFGFSFTHFSNGATSVPNFGINLAAPRIGLTYQFQPERPELISAPVPEYQPAGEWLIGVSVGAKQVEFDTAKTGLSTRYLGVDYGIATITSTWSRQFGYTSKAGIGLDLSYDGSTSAQVDVSDGKPDKVSVPFADKISLGTHATYEQVIDRLSILLGVGYYLLRKKIEGQPPKFYQKLGIKYHVSDHWFAGIILRVYDFGVADYIEWNVGYRWQWR